MPNNPLAMSDPTMAIKKIMVVDDSPTERAFMENLLKKRGYEVIRRNGQMTSRLTAN